MFERIDAIIKERGITPSNVDYHTIRLLDKNGKIRALVAKGDNVVHIEYICPKCGHYEYLTQEWKKVSKGAKYRFEVKCAKCGEPIKVEKLKGGPKSKKKEPA